MSSGFEASSPLDIKHLLELLNASDSPVDDERSVARLDAVPPGDGKTVEVSSLPDHAVEGDQLVRPEDPELDVDIARIPADDENKFAAHIVQGMSKLKAR